MHSVELDDLNQDSLLAAIHPQVSELNFDSDEPLDSWADLARAFPNLKRISFQDLGNVAGKALIDAEFFRQFSQLTELEVDSRGRRQITADLSGVETHHLAQMRTLKLERCRPHNLQVLSTLPGLTELAMTLNSTEVEFCLGADSPLRSLTLGLGSGVRKLSCTLADSAIQTLSLGKLDYYADEAGPLAITALSLPATLTSLKMDLSCKGAPPSCLLGDNRVMESVVIKLAAPSLPGDLLGELAEADEFQLELSGETAPLPPQLLAKLTRANKMELRFEGTPVTGPLLTQGLAVKDLFYSNRGERLTQVDWRLPELERAWIFGIQGDQLGWMAHSPALRELNVQVKGELTEFPELPELNSLTIRGGKMAQLPAGIRHSASLKTLNLLAVSAERFGELAAMTALQKIWLQPWERDQEKLPKQSDLIVLPALDSLRLDIDMERFDPAWVALPAGLELDIPNEKLAQAWTIFKASHLSDEEILPFLTTLVTVRKPVQLPEMPASFHLVLMAAKHNRFKAQHKQWLADVARDNQRQRPFGPGSTLFVAGRSGFKATELKAKAQEVGFTLSKKLDDGVSHILLGTAPKDPRLIDLERYAVIDDAILQQCFEAQSPKFLQQEGSDAMEESVLAMLASPDEASHKVAVQMLEQGGVTEPMRLPLFFILKTTPDNGLRKQIKHLLAGMGNEAFQLAVNDRILFHNCRGRDDYGNLKGQGVMVDKLKRQRKKWGEGLCNDFAKLYFDRFGEGLMFVLMQKEVTEQRLAILDSLVEGQCLNWRKGAGFDQIQEFWDDEPQSNLHWHPRMFLNNDSLLGAAKTELPAELARRHTITHLDLGNCLLSALPKGVEHFGAITSLSLANNTLEELPSSLATFTELQELDLSYNHFWEFPEVLMKMPWLKRLDIRRASRPDLDSDYGADYRSLQVPQAFIDACPHCEILQDD